jgi:hypothetical protein
MSAARGDPLGKTLVTVAALSCVFCVLVIPNFYIYVLVYVAVFIAFRYIASRNPRELFGRDANTCDYLAYKVENLLRRYSHRHM